MKITAVDAITKSKSRESTEFVLHIPSEYDYRYMSDRREDVIQALKEGYAVLSGKNLPIYGVPHHFLKDFVMTKSDRKKSIWKVPGEEFRLKEEDVMVEAVPVPGMFDEIPNFKKTKATSLYQKNKADKRVLIDEFKVLKVLGKGSFGKARALCDCW
jgi:hypothetical protein